MAKSFASRYALLAALGSPFLLFAACSDDEGVPANAYGPDAGNADAALRAEAAVDTAIEASQVQIGESLVDKYRCHKCHDRGDGSMAGRAEGVTFQGDAGDVLIYPANLTPDPETGLGTAANGWSDEQIARAIRTGIDDECKTLCSIMPKFDLTDLEVAAIIAYLRALPPISNAVVSGCPSLDPSHGGGGVSVPEAGSCSTPEPEDAGADAPQDASDAG